MARRGRRRAESRCNRSSGCGGEQVSSGLERSDRKNDGGQGRNRTADASLFRAALYQLSYLASFAGFTRKLSVGPDKTCAVWNVLDYNNQTGIAQMSVSICKDSVEQCPFVLAPSSFRLSPLSLAFFGLYVSRRHGGRFSADTTQIRCLCSIFQ